MGDGYGHLILHEPLVEALLGNESLPAESVKEWLESLERRV